MFRLLSSSVNPVQSVFPSGQSQSNQSINQSNQSINQSAQSARKNAGVKCTRPNGLLLSIESSVTYDTRLAGRVGRQDQNLWSYSFRGARPSPLLPSRSCPIVLQYGSDTTRNWLVLSLGDYDMLSNQSGFSRTSCTSNWLRMRKSLQQHQVLNSLQGIDPPLSSRLVLTPIVLYSSAVFTTVAGAY
jgi:hypothetical protein